MALIIGGLPRSGTTILQEVLNGHPDIRVTKEFGVFAHLDRPYIKHCGYVVKRLFRIRNRFSWEGSRQADRAALLSNLGMAVRYLVRSARYFPGPITAGRMETTLKSAFPGAAVVGDKLPHYLFTLEKIIDAENLDRLIIYRDCRDVTSSFLEMARTDWRDDAWANHLRTARQVARHWVKGIGVMERFSAGTHIVRYEDMIADPRQVFDSIGSWLDVDPAGFPIGRIRPGSVGSYQKRLTGEEQAEVLEEAGATLARLGYI
jgi:hypothetical protein